jgi:hypothetical protein
MAGPSRAGPGSGSGPVAPTKAVAWADGDRDNTARPAGRNDGED